MKPRSMVISFIIGYVVIIVLISLISLGTMLAIQSELNLPDPELGEIMVVFLNISLYVLFYGWWGILIGEFFLAIWLYEEFN